MQKDNIVAMFKVWMTKEARDEATLLINESPNPKETEKKIYNICQGVWEKSIDFKILKRDA